MRRKEFNGGLLAIKEALITEIQDELKFINREIMEGLGRSGRGQRPILR